MLDIPPTIKNEIIPEIKKKISSKDKKQCVMWVMDGDRGSGKTSASLQIHREIRPSFDIRQQTSFDFDEIVNREMNEIPPGEGHHIDEIRFERMDFRTREGVMIKKVVKEIRPWQHFITLTTPDAHDVMDVFLTYADYYSFFIDEGTMLLFKKNSMIMRGNKFGLDKKNFHKITDKKSFNKYFKKPAKRAGTYVGRFTFPQYTRKFTKKDYKIYNKLRMEKSRELIGDSNNKTKREQSLENKIAKQQGYLDIAFRFSVNELDMKVKDRMRMFGLSNRKAEQRWRERLQLI